MNQQAYDTVSFSMSDLLFGILRRRLMLANFLVMGLCLGLAVVTLFKPKYISEAQVLVDNLSTPYDQSTSQQGEQRVEQIDERFVASQIAVIDSEDQGQKVLRQLDLIGKGEFEPLADGVGTIKQWLISAGFSNDPRLMTPEERAYDTLVDNLTVYPLPMSNVIGIKYTASDGKTAADVANALAESYVLSTRERQSGNTDRARTWLSAQIDDLRGKVSKSEAAVEAFRSEQGLLRGQTSTLSSQEISELNSQITLAETASSEAEARAEEIAGVLRNTGSVDASAEVLNSPVIQSLRQQQLSISRKITDLSATYLPGHPKMRAAQKESDQIDKQVRREAIKIVDSLRGQANIASARAASLRERLDELKTKEGATLQQDVKLKELEREASANRTLLETMLARYADANARQDLNLQPGYARIINTATAASAPYFPKVGPTVLITTLMGLGLGFGLAMLFEIMNMAARLQQAGVSAPPLATVQNQPPTIETAHVSRTAPQPVVVPDLVEPEFVELKMQRPTPKPQTVIQPQLVASINSPATLAESFALLKETTEGRGLAEPVARIAAAIGDIRAKTGAKAYCMMSVGGFQDAAFASVAVARTLAMAGIKTIVIDADPGRPAAMDMVGLPMGAGLAELVAGSADFTKVIQRDPASEVKIVRFGQRGDDFARNQVATRMEAILEALTQIFDVVLVHAGEASPFTPNAVKGTRAAVFLAPASRQRDAVSAAATLAQRGIHQSVFVKLENVANANERLAS